MSDASAMTIEDRLDLLEKEVAALRLGRQAEPDPDDWKSVVGMFAGDDIIAAIQSEGRRLRESDRP